MKKLAVLSLLAVVSAASHASEVVCRTLMPSAHFESCAEASENPAVLSPDMYAPWWQRLRREAFGATPTELLLVKLDENATLSLSRKGLRFEMRLGQ
jgi:hypothetical protein